MRDALRRAAGGKTPRKRAPRNPAARRQEIIDAAADLISREGTARVTNRRVAERAGVPLGSTTQYFKSIDELRRAGLAELSRRIEREYDEVFEVVAEGSRDARGSEALADAISEYLSDPVRVGADAALCAAAVEDPEVRDITRAGFDAFLGRCAPLMDVERAKILFAFTEGAVLNSCYMGVPYDRQTIRLAVALILGDAR
ncbi:TetR/AcrR family transcriptional regulator [Adlercreutzia faecimuris]|uniref:TetR family transcriptional regulator n=1 Tax=Adlercreutzia faecimuris TaxID=2897341 RepID=A0ABS9WKB7_9ACTN|nr:TetR family transcriptional regulator [Adlercreutzia sp. JBNU-10]MCI2242872.1 TetR family transcriptional regulator [Adlercreutzia sp. JBNU-10]